MCGISGFTWKDEDLIARMNQALQHRGPDDQSVYMDHRVTLGHRRLSIIDLSPAGRQPKCNEDGSVWIVFNGEIYNFQELRSDLEKCGHIFTSNTDTEVIIHAYEEWGEGCVERFNGMWAFAIYDKGSGLLFLSRDRFGVKPLYFSQQDGGLIFSSEIRAILQHMRVRAPEDRTVYDFLVSGFLDHTPQTFFSGIERLMPGESMIYDLSCRQGRRIRWYDLEDRLKVQLKEGRAGPGGRRAGEAMEGGADESESAKGIRELFMDSVRYRLISDVPVGSCLSGGIDSSAIVYAMRRLNRSAMIKTFSMIFPGKKEDESSFIEQVVSDTDASAHYVTPTPVDLRRDLIDLIRTQEEPFASLSIYGQYKVMELAHRSGMKVLLDGQGSDEVFAGYFIYYKYYLFESLLRLRPGEAAAAAKRIKNKLNDLLLFPAMTVLSRLGLSSGPLQRLWLSRRAYLRGYEGVSLSNPLLDRGFDLNRALRSDLLSFSIPQLLRYEDKNSMRWSIESRVPFLDYRLVEAAAALPSRCKIHGGTTKYILRKALQGLVSDRILDRRDKIGFATPDRDLLDEPALKDLADEVIGSQEFASRRYWDSKEVWRLWKEMGKEMGSSGRSKSRGANSTVLWRILSVELWLREFIDSER